MPSVTASATRAAAFEEPDDGGSYDGGSMLREEAPASYGAPSTSVAPAAPAAPSTRAATASVSTRIPAIAATFVAAATAPTASSSSTPSNGGGAQHPVLSPVRVVFGDGLEIFCFEEDVGGATLLEDSDDGVF